jgi:hypothetical protein
LLNRGVELVLLGLQLVRQISSTIIAYGISTRDLVVEAEMSKVPLTHKATDKWPVHRSLRQKSSADWPCLRLCTDPL